jgi:pyridinium-3,5-biscarboxylic acid mononucleotide synthase
VNNNGSDHIVALLEAVRDGHVTVMDALTDLKAWPYEDLGDVRVDHHRSLRQGFPEVVFCPGKTPEQVAVALERIADGHGVALATRATAEQVAAAQARVPDARHEAAARAIVVDRRTDLSPAPGVVVAAAGTADIPVAEEAAITAELMGNGVTRLYDVGVSGLHRLLSQLRLLQEARAIVVVAGMEGALPSVVGGLVSAPVIAVPTSVGYGSHLGGLAPLLTMLNTCAPGVAVVNIDNGFGAGFMVGLINRQSAATGHAHATPTTARPAAGPPSGEPTVGATVAHEQVSPRA